MSKASRAAKAAGKAANDAALETVDVVATGHGMTRTGKNKWELKSGKDKGGKSGKK
jgi:hypothetical protein